MKSLILKAVYTGLGVAGTGKDKIEQLGQRLAHQAGLSEKHGEKIARQLAPQTEKSARDLQKFMKKEVTKIADLLKTATGNAAQKTTGKPAKGAKNRTKHALHRRLNATR